ncbi:trehalose-6-phosphate synthase [Candidatus Glomeribacter gigasporarum BEG34]|uniref:Trehalose-6-phosphate synthase n=1 Tax=Candidatus Glomeribacter gigasporarum BEG34 TaxID=1070319 RepID=G2J8G8_9BURK|nr:alpha,alpha-trehalose-phosphate synthase (UDP-forming) [Candidatus Glomeribacter gigasporarum]CCD29065.1 trehalose-6-phosphate synthase [Candidatus Glomeribacter gigasporarum BEG34]
MNSRLIVVSNRVAPPQEGRSAAGGLAVGVFDALRETGGLWFGWNGDTAPEAKAAKLEARGNITYATVTLSRKDYDQYYRGFSNAILWPTFHYRNDLARYDRQEYAGYLRVNDWLARQLIPLLQPDDLIWVHDYHLIPFAAALRNAGSRHPVGFFLHIPFPMPEILRTIPPHAALIEALCQYDVVGFQTRTDLQAFTDYITRYAPGTVDRNGVVRLHGHALKAAVYPIGIYPDAIANAAQRYSHRRPVTSLRVYLQHRKLIISVDRLDYSKGLIERFLAFERLLQNAPELHGKVTFVQIAPPTRTDVQAYQRIRGALEGEAGRINGRFAQLDWTPIRYLNRKYERNVLMALFRAAHVGYVTPLRDGMNLVAKEYVAAQAPHDPGVLVLSQFSGAADELTDALLVNPFDSAQMAEALQAALSMPLEQRQARHCAMMRALHSKNLSVWLNAFLRDLQRTAAH